MKLNEERLIYKIKALAKQILRETPECTKAQSIIDLCEVIDSDSPDITITNNLEPVEVKNNADVMEDIFYQAAKDQYGK